MALHRVTIGVSSRGSTMRSEVVRRQRALIHRRTRFATHTEDKANLRKDVPMWHQMIRAKLRKACCSAGLIVVAALSACNSGYSFGQPTKDAGPLSAGGRLFSIDVVANGLPVGSAVNFSALPSSITVSPSMVTVDEQQHASTVALVPYGTTGAIVASAGSTPSLSVDVSVPPLSVARPNPSALDGGSNFSPVGQVYMVSVKVLAPSSCDAGICDAGPAAPAGVSVTFTATQLAQSGGDGMAITSTGLTDTTGTATAILEIPWGPEVIVQAAAGGGINMAVIPASYDPVSVSCVFWTQQSPGLYAIAAQVVDGTTPIVAAPVTFSVVLPTSASASIIPMTAVTDDSGLATAVVGIGDAGAPVVVEALSGNSVLPTTIGGQANGDAGVCVHGATK
jgi:hypothetical protein